MRGEPYTTCNISPYRFPAEGRQPEPGDYLLSAAGTSAYLIEGVHELEPLDREWNRYKLICKRWPVDEIPADAVIHTIHWDSRRRKVPRG